MENKNDNKNVTILVVDDSPSNRFIIKEMFSEYRVVEAINGSEMLVFIEKEIPDIILLDVMMPGEDGFSLAKKLSQSDRTKNIPIIFVTAKDSGADVVIGFNSGAYDYIKKPFDQDEMIARVKSVIYKSQKEKYLTEQSRTDSLTGIYNRRYFSERLSVEIERSKRNHEPISIAMLDIDFFKKINDTYGHQAGDYILKSFSVQINSQIRPYDILARFGGEEYIVLFPKIIKKDALSVLTRLQNVIQSFNFKFDEKCIKFTFSCGISDSLDFADSEISSDKIIALSDKRLYEAKRTGRNRIIID